LLLNETASAGGGAALSGSALTGGIGIVAPGIEVPL